MKRIVLYLALAVSLLTAALAGALFLCINSPAIQRIALGRINGAIPGSFTAGMIHLDPFDLSLQICDAVLYDSAGCRLAGLDTLFMDCAIKRPLHHDRRLVVESLRISRPHATLFIDSTGRLTLPDAFGRASKKGDTASATQSDTSSFPIEVEVVEALVTGGGCRFVMARNDLSIEAGGLFVRASAQSAALCAAAEVKIDTVTYSMGSARAALDGFDLSAQMRWPSIDTFSLSLRTVQSEFDMHGSVRGLVDSLLLDVAAALRASLREVRDAAGIDVAMGGAAQLSMRARGPLANPNLDLELSCTEGRIQNVSFDTVRLDAKIRDRVLKILPLFVSGEQGQFIAKGRVDCREFFPDGFLSAVASTQGIGYDLEIDAQGIALERTGAGLSGIAGARLALSGRGVVPDSLDAKIKLAGDAGSLRLDASREALDATVACSASIQGARATVHALSGSCAGAKVVLSGRYDFARRIFEARTDLAVPSIDTFAAFAGKSDISGGVAASIELHGDAQNPQAKVDLVAEDLCIGPLRNGTVVLGASSGPDDTIRIERLSVNTARSHAVLSAHGRILDGARLLPADSMSFIVALNAPSLSVSEFVDSADGIVSVEADVTGTVRDMHGALGLRAVDITFGELTAKGVDLDAKFEGDRVNVETLSVRALPDQALTASGWLSLRDSFDITLKAPDIRLEKIPALVALDSVSGAVSLDLHASGPYRNPVATGTIALGSLQRGKLKFRDGRLDLSLMDMRAKVTGNFAGNDLFAWYDVPSKAFEASFDVKNLYLMPFLAPAAAGLDGQMSAKLHAAGNAASFESIEGSLDLANLQLSYNGINIVKTNGLNASLANGRYTVPAFNITLATDGTLSGHAEGSLKGPHDVAIDGIVPLSITRYFFPEFGDVLGSISIGAFFRGDVFGPDMKAEVRFNDVGMSIPGLSQRLQRLNGRIVADPKSIRMESLEANIDDGALSAQATLSLDSMRPSDLRASITMQSVPIGLPDMLDLELDGRLRIEGSPETAKVTGDITLLEGLYYRDIVINPLASMGKRRRKESVKQADSVSPYLGNVSFDVGVTSRSPLRVDNNLAELSIDPDLHLMGTFQAPSLSGRADVKQGTVTYLGQTFTVNRGVIDFVNPYAIVPEVDIRGTVPVHERTVEVRVSGPTDDLLFTLIAYDNTGTEDQSLEDQDIISLLVLGKTTGELQREIRAGGGGSGEQSTQQMLASLVASTFGGEIRKRTGFDMLEVETGDVDDENSDRIAVTVGKQVTRRLGTKYTIESEDREIVQRATAIYRIQQNLSLEGFQDTKGVYGGSLNFFWERR